MLSFVRVWLTLSLSLAGCAPAPHPGPSRDDYDAVVRVPVGADPTPPWVADVDGDGHLDVLVALDNAEHASLAVLLGDGRGGLRPGPLSAFAAPAQELACGDVNGDGRIDAVVGWHDRLDGQLLLGDGQGGFAPAGVPIVLGVGFPPHTHCLALHDVDGDGHLDLLATQADGRCVAVLLGNGGGDFRHAPGSPTAAGNHPYDAIAGADLDGDGHRDLAVPDLHGDAVVVLRGSGDGRFVPAAPIAVGDRPGFVVAADLDRDGDVDLAVSHDDDPLVVILTNDGHAGFTRAADRRFPQPVWTVSASDLDGDGVVDLACSSHRGRGAYLLRGSGDGGFAEPRLVDFGAGVGGLVVADLDRDGHPDLIASLPEAGAVAVRRGASR